MVVLDFFQTLLLIGFNLVSTLSIDHVQWKVGYMIISAENEKGEGIYIQNRWQPTMYKPTLDEIHPHFPALISIMSSESLPLTLGVLIPGMGVAAM
jgi:hypothetical protein